MAYTERARYQFLVKQRNGKPWIYFQPVEKNLSILESEQRLRHVADFSLLGFDLPEGTTFEEAETLADLLDEKIRAVSLTRLVDVGY